MNILGINASAITGNLFKIGSTGPGGGKVFYIGSFTGGPSGTTMTHLEAAPNTWSGGAADPTRTWATNVNSNQTTAVSGADGTAIGTGWQNSLDIANQSGNDAATCAAVEARNYTTTVLGITYSDWYLPSSDEISQLYSQRLTVGGFASTFYWNSSEATASTARFYNFQFNTTGTNNKSVAYRVRPIRAFYHV